MFRDRTHDLAPGSNWRGARVASAARGGMSVVMLDDPSQTGSGTLARRAAAWACGFALFAGATLGIDAGFTALWHTASRGWGLGWTMGVTLALLAAVSLAAAVLQGRVRLPAREARLRIAWAVRMLPYGIRDLGGLRGVSSGRRNRRWDSLAAFETDDRRRGVGPDRGDQTDFGVHWYDRGRYVGRLTYIHDTGEIVTATEREGGAGVELLGVFGSEQEVERRLRNWSYAALGAGDLRWVRRRLHGWWVPLAPRAQWWLEEDARSPQPWPAPPAPSVGRSVGAYHGRTAGHDYKVLCVDDEGERPLYHAVEHSPTGYAWGYAGSGPSDLAQSLLLDRLGYVPQPRIVFGFRDDVVARLDETFVLTYEDVDAWIDAHASWFAKNPRAVPLDPFAAGGAYE